MTWVKFAIVRALKHLNNANLLEKVWPLVYDSHGSTALSLFLARSQFWIYENPIDQLIQGPHIIHLAVRHWSHILFLWCRIQLERIMNKPDRTDSLHHPSPRYLKDGLTYSLNTKPHLPWGHQLPSIQHVSPAIHNRWCSFDRVTTAWTCLLQPVEKQPPYS